MAGGKQRVTRSCGQQNVEADKQTERSSGSRTVSAESKTGSQPSTCEKNKKTKCQPKGSNSSSKKRPLKEDVVEKENVKLSKGVGPTSSCSSTKENISNECDSNNNESIDHKTLSRPEQIISNSKSSKKSRINSSKAPHPSPNPLPSSATSFSKSLVREFEQSPIQNFPLQLATDSQINSRNIYHQYLNSMVGKSPFHNSEALSRITANPLSEYEIAYMDKPFQCRITSIEWHPRKRSFLGVGSKHGDMVFYKIQNEDNSKLEEVQNFSGIGPGGNIPSMKFHPTLDNLVYTSSLCGKVSLVDIEGGNKDVLLDTMSWDFWYSSLDVHKTDFFVAAGRNKGGTALLDKDGKCIWDKKLHRQKISHLEFSPRDPHIFCTASLDHSVKIWDLRKVVEKNPLEILIHKHGLNSAYFSLTDGCRLLTTDQNQELRIYSYPSWNLERIIVHPHRFFQHITPIKAYWHPHRDIIFCGRYPNVATLPEFRPDRCIDMFEASTGQKLGEIFDPPPHGIISLVKMNNEGTKLATAMGYHLNLWNSQDRKILDLSQASYLRTSLQAARSVATKRPRSDSQCQRKKVDKDILRKKEMKMK